MSLSSLRYSSSNKCMYNPNNDINKCCSANCKPVYNTNLKKSFNDTTFTKKQRYSHLVNNTKYTTIFPFQNYDISQISDGNLGNCANGIDCNYSSGKYKNNVQYNLLFGISNTKC